MESMMLKLKPGVALMERDGTVGLSLAGCTRFAKDEWQAALLRLLAAHEKSLDELQMILHERDVTPPGEAAEALELAAFILDFEDFLES